jgi:E3 ubiquitin-protein ligase RNF213
MSDSASIQHQFHMACRYQQHANNTITILLLDEVGLAEHSPEMPLKCLHGILVDPPIAVVGLSNWVLDPAKMNRAVLVQRPQPKENDIALTGSSIFGLCDPSGPLFNRLEQIAKAYYSVYTRQKDRDFIGMRDYYSLIKLIRELLASKTKTGKIDNFNLNVKEMVEAICRNFGGKDDHLIQMIAAICSNLYGSKSDSFEELFEKGVSLEDLEKKFQFRAPHVVSLIRSNLKSASSRHLMLLTKNCSALWMLFSCDLVKSSEVKVIIGSEFSEDQTELHVVQRLNEVKLAMATGKVIVLLNADNMYEALYDVLNQRYLVKKDQKTGNVHRLLRLAIGCRSSLCHVECKY